MKPRTDSFRNLRTTLQALIFLWLSVPFALPATPGTRINSGGNVATDAHDNIWSADVNFAGGLVAAPSANAINTSAVTNPAPVACYQTERYGAHSYTVGGLTAGATYNARLHFAEVYWTTAGQRKFNVFINGLQVLNDFDILATAGAANKAVVQTFPAVANALGQVVVQFVAGSIDLPKISALEILPSGSVPIDVALNAGGPAVGAFAADGFFTGGTASIKANAITTTGVADPAPVTLYQSERYGPCTYTITGLTVNTLYTVRLHFAEIWFTGAPGQGAVGSAGQRKFNVSINGIRELTNYDVFAAAGGANKAVIEEFAATSGTTGQITIQFSNGSADVPTVDGIELIASEPLLVPVVSSAGSASGQVGNVFSYQITASNSPTSFSAAPLPPGLSVNGSGLISGMPTTAAINVISLGATNAAGTGTKALTLTVTAPPAPVVTSATTATGLVGSGFTYQISATNNPTGYGATGLPAGLNVNAATGLISGTPTAAGVSSISLSATNSGGTGTKALGLTINTVPGPAITSAGTASGQVGATFTYQITATNNPTGFGAIGLPAGLTVNAAGLISGTPTAAGISTISLSATNAGGTGSATLILTTGGIVRSINAGGLAVGGFGVDANFVGGTATTHANAISTAGVTNPAPLAVYQTERWGNSTYTFPGLSAGASYRVRFHFAETWFTGAAGQGVLGNGGQRQFNVALNGTPVLTNFDIFAETGGANRAIVKEFNAIASPTGQIIVQLAAGLKDNATINGLELISQGPPPAPVITSSGTASGQVGMAFSYQITASNNPTGFSAAGLPAGLNVNASTGLISGTPSAVGGSTISLGASNAGGTGNKTLTLAVAPQPAPVITSTGTASGQVGAAFSYQITATNNPTVFSASGLPAGLTVNPAGLISGTPTAAGVSTILLTATNASGAGTKILSFTVFAGPTYLAIHAGTDLAGQYYGAYAADTPYAVGGTLANNPNPIVTTGVTNPAPAAVYQSERWGPSGYTVTGLAVNSAYIVRLHFAETYFTGTAQRQFNVKINGIQRLTNFDIVAAAGAANKAVVKQFNATSDAAGKITVEFINGAANNAKIDGIEFVAGILPPAVFTSLALTPNPAVVLTGKTQQFTAVAKDQNGDDMAFPTPPVWTASGGSVDTSGLYTAGLVSGTTYFVTVSCSGKSATAPVTVSDHKIGPVTQYGWLKLVNGHLCDKDGNPIQLTGMSAHHLNGFPWSADTVKNLVEEYHTTLARAAMYIDEGGYLNGDAGGIEAKMRTIVSAAIANDIYVIIDWHGVGGNPNDAVNESKAFFARISAEFKNVPNIIYEIYNEPNVDWGAIKNYANQVIPVIQANAPNSIILVGTPGMSSAVGVVKGDTLPYSNLMYVRHFYCGNATNEADNPGGRAEIDDLMANGIAVFVSEWGTSNWTGDGGPYPVTATNYINWMKANKISWANWSLSTKAEGSAFLRSTASMNGPWTANDLSPAGTFLQNKF